MRWNCDVKLSNIIPKGLFLVAIAIIGYSVYAIYFQNQLLTSNLDIELIKQECVDVGKFYIDRTQQCKSREELPAEFDIDADYLYHVSKRDYVKLVVCYYEDDEITILDCARIVTWQIKWLVMLEWLNY